MLKQRSYMDQDPIIPVAEQVTPRIHSAIKTVVLSSGMTVFGIMLALLLIEVGFRLLHNAPPPNWRDRPNVYFVPEGAPTLQDVAHEVVKPAGTYRIAVVGDSFTFAPYMQFDDAFPKRLERWFNLNTTQPRVDVINYGVPAYSTNHEVPVVVRAVVEQADLIVVQITLNDPELKPYTPQQLLLEKNKFGALELPDTWIFRHWHSLVFALTRLHNNETRRNYTKKFFDLFERKATWDNFRGSWEHIAHIGKKKGVPVVAVIFPLFGVPVDESYPFWPIDQKITKLLASLNVPALDVTEIYRGIPVERLQVLPGEDFHPNEIAHRMAAEAIYTWLVSNKIVPVEISAKVTVPARIGISLPQLE